MSQTVLLAEGNPSVEEESAAAGQYAQNPVRYMANNERYVRSKGYCLYARNPASPCVGVRQVGPDEVLQDAEQFPNPFPLETETEAILRRQSNSCSIACNSSF
jgi:hypothetical protein